MYRDGVVVLGGYLGPPDPHQPPTIGDLLRVGLGFRHGMVRSINLLGHDLRVRRPSNAKCEIR